VALLEQVGSLLQNSITLVAMAGVLVLYNPWLPAVLLVSTLPALLVVLRYDRRYHRWWQGTTAERRRAQYFDSVLTSPITAAELRLFDLGGHFGSGYQTVRRRLRLERLEHVKQQSVARLAAGGGGLFVTGLALAWMLWRATLGMVTLGDLVLLYQAFQRGQGLMRSLLGNVSQIYSNTLFLEQLFAFLDLKAQVTDPVDARPIPTGVTRGITFRNVTFRYPGAERPALQDFTLTIPANKVVAIVGANGAGKSTLLKLMCRLYDPESGRVELDGVDVRHLPVNELRRMITVLFQFPVAYQATAAQNIELGDLHAAPGAREIKNAARAAGVDDAISRLARGYDTHLGKWFADGAELSGGEWQKVAMARAFLRQAPIIILDEPTSFMDSWAEADWFDRFRALAQGRAGLIITHRFTIAMRADNIHVMDEGRIVESGSHQELLASGGLYAQSWLAQMQAASTAVEQVA
jgi:ATP-binding cassette subfamily B protein